MRPATLQVSAAWSAPRRRNGRFPVCRHRPARPRPASSAGRFRHCASTATFSGREFKLARQNRRIVGSARCGGGAPLRMMVLGMLMARDIGCWRRRCNYEFAASSPAPTPAPGGAQVLQCAARRFRTCVKQTQHNAHQASARIHSPRGGPPAPPAMKPSPTTATPKGSARRWRIRPQPIAIAATTSASNQADAVDYSLSSRKFARQARAPTPAAAVARQCTAHRPASPIPR